MTIGLVLSKPPNYSETFFNSKIKGLLSNGYEVVLFVQEANSNFDLCKVIVAPRWSNISIFQKLLNLVVFSFKLIFVPKRVIRFLRFERRAQHSLKVQMKHLFMNVHLLTAHLDWLHFGFATLALQREFVAKSIGAQMAVSCRGYDMDVYPLKHPNCYALLWQEVHKVHVISKYMLSCAYKNGMKKETPYQIIRPAIVLSKFIVQDKKPIQDPLRLLTVARLHWMKGIGDTLEALSFLKTKGIPFKYTIVGSGPEEEALKFSVHQLNLNHEVVFKGQLSHNATIEVLKETDVYLQYSYSEGFCNAVLEAQASGCLCIVSDGGALPENVIHGQTGWVVERRQPKLLMEKIIEVMQLEETAQHVIRAQALDRVSKSFTLKIQNKMFKTFYQNHA